MTLIATLMAVVLVAIAAIHLAWGLGMTWPGRDQQNLIDTVIGHPEATRLPGFAACVAVAVALLLAAAWALWGVGLIAIAEVGVLGVPLGVSGLVVLVVVFLGRGVATYLPTPLSRAVEPFRTLDRRAYAPLCLLLGMGFLVILVVGQR